VRSSTTRAKCAPPVRGCSRTRGIAAEAGKIRVGHALSEGTQMGPLVSRDQFDRVSGFVEQGCADGVTVVAGGKRVGDGGHFIAPTVLTGVKTDMSVFREEIFGPVLCAMTFNDDDLDRIADEANDTMGPRKRSRRTRFIHGSEIRGHVALTAKLFHAVAYRWVRYGEHNRSFNQACD
jgi:hypothetical protein